jgi:DNA polymerase-3 subunit epsilon
MHAAQLSLADLGTPLHQVAFTVVDLETTGGSPAASAITEIGAVRVEGGEVAGEFHTLVDPGLPIPASITALTGITDAVVAGWPRIAAVLPSFLEFSRGSALVAHNARFDVSFLNANLTRLDYPALDNPVVCTAALARRLVRDEVHNLKLGTLARFFRCRTEPNHRALTDARATVEVFHGLLERAGSFGMLTLEDLLQFSSVRNAPLFKARRGLADGLPASPGVYAFRSASGELLYVGKATDLRSRVRQYFGGDPRRKIADLMKETAAVDHWVCPTPLEAAVRELRLIQSHKPRFNRRSKTPERGVWLRLTDDAFPRLSIVRTPPPADVAALGPLPSRRVAERIAEALHDALPIRRCTERMRAATRFAPCALADMRRCVAPCDGRVDADGYAAVAAGAAHALRGDPSLVAAAIGARMRSLGAAGRVEEAAAGRDRLEALVAASRRDRRVQALLGAGAVVAARSRRDGTVELVAIRDGRFTASRRVPVAGRDAAVAELRALLAQAPLPEAAGAGAAAAEAAEADLLARWLEEPGTRMEHSEGACAEAVAGGLALSREHDLLSSARRRTARPELELADKRQRRAAG